MTASVTPPGFYATTAQSLWGSTPLSPLEAKSLIPVQLQQGLALYRKLFPPPPPGSFWQTWGPVLETVAVFAVGAAALSLVGTAGAASAASTAAQASATAASSAAAASTSATTALTTLTAGLPASQASSGVIATAMSAMQSGAGYVAPALGAIGKITGNTTAQKLASFANAISQPSAKKALTDLTGNLFASQLPPGTQLSPADQAMIDNIIQGKQAQYAAALETQSNQLAAQGYANAQPIVSGASSLTTYGILGIAGLIALKIGGFL